MELTLPADNSFLQEAETDLFSQLNQIKFVFHGGGSDPHLTLTSPKNKAGDSLFIIIYLFIYQSQPSSYGNDSKTHQ